MDLPARPLKMSNLESRVKRMEERTGASERGPVDTIYFTDLVNSRKDLKDGELLGVRLNCEQENKHFPRLPGELEATYFARVKADHGGAPTFPIRTMMYNGKLVVRGTKTVKFQPLTGRRSERAKT